jgi:hypothetical protein
MDEILQAIISSDTSNKQNYEFYSASFDLVFDLFSRQRFDSKQNSLKFLFLSNFLNRQRYWFLISHLANSLCSRLFTNFIEQKTEPAVPNGFFISAYSYIFAKDDVVSVLAEKSLMLLLVILSQPHSDIFRNALDMFQNVKGVLI